MRTVFGVNILQKRTGTATKWRSQTLSKRIKIDMIIQGEAKIVSAKLQRPYRLLFRRIIPRRLCNVYIEH